VFRMMALAVDGKMRWQRLATGAIARLKAELLLVAGPRQGCNPVFSSGCNELGIKIFGKDQEFFW
jgi:hypothetical protein